MSSTRDKWDMLHRILSEPFSDENVDNMIENLRVDAVRSGIDVDEAFDREKLRLSMNNFRLSVLNIMDEIDRDVEAGKN